MLITRSETTQNQMEIENDKPVVGMVCAGCGNRRTCSDLHRTLTALKKAELHGLEFSSKQERAMNLLRDHLRREGYDYPRVRHRARCWIHNKPGVARFYLSHMRKISFELGH